MSEGCEITIRDRASGWLSANTFAYIEPSTKVSINFDRRDLKPNRQRTKL